jgi:hypothetical protein
MSKEAQQREIDIKNLRYYAQLFEAFHWDTPQAAWNVFMTTLNEIADRLAASAAESGSATVENPEELCSDCPPMGYPTDKTRCLPCPRRASLPSEGQPPAQRCGFMWSEEGTYSSCDRNSEHSDDRGHWSSVNGWYDGGHRIPPPKDIVIASEPAPSPQTTHVNWKDEVNYSHDLESPAVNVLKKVIKAIAPSPQSPEDFRAWYYTPTECGHILGNSVSTEDSDGVPDGGSQCLKCRVAELERTAPRETGWVAPVKALVDKLDVVIPKVDDIIALQTVRSGYQAYDGPNLTDELKAVRALLVAAAPEQKGAV